MDYSSYDEMTSAMAAGVTAVYAIIVLVISVLTIIAMWKIFVKAGKPGWASIVPFYSQYCLFEIAWGNGWLFLLMLIPCVNVVVSFIVYIKLAKAFGQGTGFGIGLIFLNPIFLLILGFGKAEYIGPQQ